nr:ORF45 [Bracoviriform inaniti]
MAIDKRLSSRFNLTLIFGVWIAPDSFAVLTTSSVENSDIQQHFYIKSVICKNFYPLFLFTVGNNFYQL